MTGISELQALESGATIHYGPSGRIAYHPDGSVIPVAQPEAPPKPQHVAPAQAD